MDNKDTSKCILCHSEEKDEIKYGEFMEKKSVRIGVHYYCLLLTSNLVQNGDDNDGFLGFMPDDIKAEAKRIRNNICVYCRKPSANIACCASRCYRMFHLTCGIENKCINYFTGTYQSFCNRHCLKVKSSIPSAKEICSVCHDDLGKFYKHLVYRAPCCKSGWFHRWCLARMALNMGYFFKCPLCNNKEEFRNYLLRKSIFIPDRDAAWEQEPDAFADLLERPNTCSAEICLCKNGRKYNQEGLKKLYTLLICNICGAKAQHRACTSEENISTINSFTCPDCKDVIEKSTAMSTNTISNILIDDVDEEKDVEVVEISSNDDDDDDDNDLIDHLVYESSSDETNEIIGNNSNDNLKDRKSLEMPALSPYKVSEDEQFNPIRLRKKRKRNVDFDSMSSSSEDNFISKTFKRDRDVFQRSIINNDSCSTSSGFSNNTTKSELIPLSFLKSSNFSDNKKSIRDQCNRNNFSMESDLNRKRGPLTRRSIRLQKISRKRSNSVSDSGIFNGNSLDDSTSMYHQKHFKVLENFRDSPEFQSNIIKCNFKARRSRQFAY